MQYRLHKSISFSGTIVFFLLLLLPSFNYGQELSDINPGIIIECRVPESAKPYDKFTAYVKIINNGYSGIMELKQKLPSGYSATKPDSQAIDFLFDNQEVNIMWYVTSETKEYSFFYTIHTGERLDDKFPFSGMITTDLDQYPFIEMINISGSPGAGQRQSQKTTPVQPEQRAVNASVQFTFDRPETVNTESTFSFMINIVKPVNYSPSAELTLNWPRGFAPQNIDIPDAGYQVNGPTITISWEHLTAQSNLSIVIPIKVRDIPRGVYPVTLFYKDANNQVTSKGTSITVNNERVANVQTTDPYKPGLVKLRLIYPQEIYLNEDFNMDIKITIGSLKGKAKLNLQLPPSVEVEVLRHTDFDYSQVTGKLMIQWANLPDEPEIEVNCRVKTNINHRAVYPISALFIVDGKETASYFNNLIIHNQYQSSSTVDNSRQISQPASFDTTATFNKLDELLEAWKKATSGDQSTVVSETIGTVLDENRSSPSSGLTGEISYRIQIIASKVVLPELSETIRSNGIFEPLNEDFNGVWYRYTVGDFNTYGLSKAYLKTLSAKGYPDTFIVKYVNGKRDTVYY